MRRERIPVRAFSTLGAPVLAALLFLGGALDAQDFIRGDVNGDGVVSISDAHVLVSYLKGAGLVPGCLNAADVDDSGQVDLEDLYTLLSTLVDLRETYPEPFSSPGLDPTPNADPALGCDSYGGEGPLEDPVARLEIIDAVALAEPFEVPDSCCPGWGRPLVLPPEWAIFTFSLTGSAPIAGFSGWIVVGGIFCLNSRCTT